MDADIKHHAIVLIGRFNPAIVHPQWLLRKGLVGETEAAHADLAITHPELSQFKVGNLLYYIQQHRFQISSEAEPYFGHLRDTAEAIFRLLPETHITQVGINFSHIFKFDDSEQYVNFGHKIAPKEDLWNHVVSEPGLLSLRIQGKRTDGYRGNILTTVSVSELIKPYGVEINVNDHYELYEGQSFGDVDSERYLELIERQYPISVRNTKTIIDRIIDYGTS